jgi:hypothetical protein
MGWLSAFGCQPENWHLSQFQPTPPVFTPSFVEIPRVLAEGAKANLQKHREFAQGAKQIGGVRGQRSGVSEPVAGLCEAGSSARTGSAVRTMGQWTIGLWTVAHSL